MFDEKTWYKTMLGLIRKIFIGLLTSIAIKNLWLYQPYQLINLHPNKYSQELHYDPSVVNLDRCAGSTKSDTHLIKYLIYLSI